MIIEAKNEQATKEVGKKLGQLLVGGEIIELIGDVGAGKTTFVKGLAAGLGVSEDVSSPSFTINRLYTARDDLQLAHYDFYRLSDPGIMKDELAETIHDPQTITVIEWADAVNDVLPQQHIMIKFTSPSELHRRLNITGDKKVLARL